MEEDGLLRCHGDFTQSTRIGYYPPCSRADEVLGLGPHSDKSSITLLLQDDDVTGLQIRHGGMWIPVKPIPNALVVNVSDSLEVSIFELLRRLLLRSYIPKRPLFL